MHRTSTPLEPLPQLPVPYHKIRNAGATGTADHVTLLRLFYHYPHLSHHLPRCLLFLPHPIFSHPLFRLPFPSLHPRYLPPLFLAIIIESWVGFWLVYTTEGNFSGKKINDGRSHYGPNLSKIDACGSRSYVATFPLANEPASEAKRNGASGASDR